MAKIFSFGKCSIKMLYLFALTLSQIMREFCGIILENKQKIFTHPFFLVWIMFLGESLIFFLFLIQKCLMKNQQDKSSGLEILPKNKKIKTILILIGLSLCDFCTSICMNY